MKFSLDIETIPNSSMVDKLPEPELKLGNVKDPEKIAAKEAEAKQKQIESMALNPFYGRVCSYATAGDFESVRCIVWDNDEEERILIECIFNDLTASNTENITVITWNGNGFDLPFIYKRAALLGVKMPTGCRPLSYWTKRYSAHPHCDMMKVMCNWEPQGIKLDDAAKCFLGRSKIEIDFRDLPKMIADKNINELKAYNLEDAKFTWEIYQKTKQYFI